MSLPASAISRVTGVHVEYRNLNKGAAGFLPQRLAVIGVGNDDAVYDTKKHMAIGSANAIAERYGFGSPLHLAARQLFPSGGGGANFPVTFYPLKRAQGSAAAKGAISCEGKPTATGSGIISIGGIDVEFAILEGSEPKAILEAISERLASRLEIPVKPGSVSNEDELPLTAKWSGSSGNDITIEIEANAPGVTFEITDMKGGAVDPEVDPALKLIGPVWETFILSCFSYNSNSRLNTFKSFGEGRWDQMEKKGCLVAHGCVDNFETRTTVTHQRKHDYINFLITGVGSPEIPFVIAARGLVNIVNTANRNPPDNNYGLLTGLKAGPDEAQEAYIVRNNSVDRGSSTSIKSGSLIELNDTVTMWHPDDESIKSRRQVVNMVKLMNVVFNIRMIMESSAVKGAPLVPDAQATRNPRAIQPKTIRTAMMNLADGLASHAILAISEFTKENLVVNISSMNPDRLDLKFPCKLSGNVEVSSNEIFFGFYLGAA
ncbi:MAG: hypothetical protein FWC97_00350 [Treponema sp.]|nr:hypothetical protein [Treponema sp.]